MSRKLKRLALAVCVLSVALPVQAYGFQVRVSAYAADRRCTKRFHPNVTASKHRITSQDCYRMVAFSPDLARQFRFGDRFRLQIKHKVYTVRYQDRMPWARRGRVDFLLPSVGSCRRFGIKRAILTPIKSEEPET
ncbi:MAG: hypothetical protein P4L55_13105 [Syntrophobacteraceae bacterium]|nr:hypothetical protein [Syntrophobacteraceae bacterium]